MLTENSKESMDFQDLENIKNILKNKQEHIITFNNYKDYKSFSIKVSNNIIENIKESLKIILYFEKSKRELADLDFLTIGVKDEEVQEQISHLNYVIKKTKLKVSYCKKDVIEYVGFFRGLKVLSSHIYSKENREEFFKNRENRLLKRELEWLVSHWEVPFLDFDTIKNDPDIKEYLIYDPEFLNKLFSFAITPKTTSVSVFLEQKSSIDFRKYLDWNGFYYFGTLQGRELVRWDPKTFKIKTINDKEQMISNIINNKPAGDGVFTPYSSTRSNRELLNSLLLTSPPFKVNPTFFRIMMAKKREARTLDIYHLTSKGFNFDYNYYNGVEKEELRKLFEFNIKSLLMLLPHLWRQGEHYVEGGMDLEVRDEILKDLPKAKKVPILTGKQTIGKTHFLDLLGGFQGFYKSGFTGELDSSDGQTAKIQYQLIEYSEISASDFKKASAIKSYIGTETNNDRKFHTKTGTTFANQNLFVATTNEEKILRDKSGNVRFMIIPLAPFESGEYKGKCLNLKELWQNEDEYINSMISLQEEYFKWLRNIEREKKTGNPATQAILDWKALFSSDIINCEECKLGEALLTGHNIYKKTEQSILEDAIMSEEIFLNLSVDDKIIAKKVAKQHNLLEAKNYLQNHILNDGGSTPANIDFKNFMNIVESDLGYKFGQHFLTKEHNYLAKRGFKFKNVNKKDIVGIVYMRDFYVERDERERQVYSE